MKKIFLLLCCLIMPCQLAFAEENLAEDLVEKFKLDSVTDGTKLLVLDTSVSSPRFYMLKRFKDEWFCLNESKAEIGKGGSTANKIEGDFATPKGIFSFVFAFGNVKNPGCILPYYQLKKGDVWVIDPQSKYYNRFVRKNTVLKEWLAEIKLYEKPVRYKYVLVLDYNVHHSEPYKGSAVFLECSLGKATEGSIGLSPSLMKELLLFVDKETKIYIL